MPDLPIVLVPGLGSSVRTHLAILPALWRHGSVMVINQTADESIEAMAARALSEAPPKFALIGHSLGGYIVLEMIRQAPERITRLALLNTYAHPETPAFAEFWRGLIAKVKQGGYRAMMDAMFAGAVHPSRANDARLKAIVTDMADDTGPDAFVWQVEAIMTRADSRPTLAAIKCPTLVMTSDTDNSVPSRMSVEIANGIAGAKLITVADCGHLSPIEQPEAVTAALRDWLEM